MKNLSNKTALVTGASRGIGAAIAKRLAREGANVAITYNSSPDRAEAVVKEIEAAGGKAIAIKADSSDPNAVKAAVDKTAETFGGLHVLVNNAGIAMLKSVEDFTLEDFDLHTSVNIRAVFAGSQAAIKHLPRGGRIITIGSCMAERVAGPGGSVYAMSKSALIGLTKGMARDLGPKGITVNLVHPGPTDTDMNPADGVGADWQRSMNALGSFGSVEDVAAMVAFLAGPESGNITGAGMLVDSGNNV
ncbi:3-oxoacyl-ACP reductase FabG [Pseudoflavitalea sp. G-6-1-2]|uniref:SDR family NAD(P)-dependent oxidoreductase n=1 Tax=Pseudoflavitalea sp. G-6-1-2 TaxID=2728841 RepID=UPI00146BA50F|nr:3-oxoacyl-ACP reductase family protein [Pseudoflavitalea sp. G-6-1-2]NML22185.1 3-oxoacyl-ACP reductase FabG [Pseudoflavitalea sp. G-6-1-2]